MLIIPILSDLTLGNLKIFAGEIAVQESQATPKTPFQFWWRVIINVNATRLLPTIEGRIFGFIIKHLTLGGIR